LWIGAGASVSAGVPADTADEHGLAYRLALIHYDNDPVRIATEVGQGFRLADLATRITKARVRELILQQGWGDLDLAPAHRAIAALVGEGFPIDIVTINLDPLLERALDREGLRPEVVYCAARCAALSQQGVFVVKLHGCPYRDNNSENLLILASDLELPPPWVETFLRGRLLERVFVYVGFSGNAEYVRESVRVVSDILGRNGRPSFGVDVQSSNEVFLAGNRLGEFYGLSGVVEERYSRGGADLVFGDLANIVFRRLLVTAIEAATADAARHGCADSAWLAAIVTRMSYEQISSFVRRLGVLYRDVRPRIRGVALRQALKWMLILACRRLLEPASFRPVLAAPYRSRQEGAASAPIIFIDAYGKEAAICRDEIAEASKGDEFRSSFQVGAEPRWYAVILNCVGNVWESDTGVIARDQQSTARGYDPIVFVDENSMTNRMEHLESLFRP